MLWVRKLGKEIQDLKPRHPAKIECLELDEIGHCAGKKRR